MSSTRTRPKKTKLLGGGLTRLFRSSPKVTAPPGSTPDDSASTISLASQSQYTSSRTSPTPAPPLNQVLPSVTPDHVTDSSSQPPKSNTPCLCRDLWNEALQKLSAKDKALVLDHVPLVESPLSEMLETLAKVAQDKRRACESKRWKLEFKGHTVMLGKLADKIVLWLDKFKQIGDIAVNVDPMHAGLPWAGIRLLLQVAVSESQQMGFLLIGLDKVLYLINRCTIYEILYLRALDPIEGLESLESLQLALVKLYAIILQFLCKAIRQFDKGTASRAFHALWNLDDVTNFEKNCKAQEEQVEIAVETCERFYNRNAREEGVRSIKELKHMLEELKEQNELLNQVDTRVTALWNKSNQIERSKILYWTSDIPYRDHHELARTRRTAGTGEWLLEHRRYQEWLSLDESMILWVHGIPGAGKTKLVSKVVDHLTEYLHNEALAYFYCDRNQGPRRQPENILRSFVKQLAMSRDQDAIQNCLAQLYEQKHREGFSSNKISSEECEALLIQLIQAYPRSFLVLDALDECDQQLRGDLIGAFNRLVNTSKGLKILISSRRDADLKHQLEKKSNVGIEATDNQKDISTFVAETIKRNQEVRRIPIPKGLQDRIVETLLEKSGGMFQWASLQIDQLLSLERISDIEKRLGKLPKGLKAAYDEIYAEIQNQEGSQPDIANRAFQWVMCACQPMSPSKLVAAVCQDPGNDEPQVIDIDMDFVLGACRNLLLVDRELNICRFAHLSVQEYFEEHCWSTSQANGLAAKVCLLLLNSPDHWEEPNNSSQKGYDSSYDSGSGSDQDNQSRKSYEIGDRSEFVNYVQRFWPIHVQGHGDSNADDRLSTLLIKFLGSMCNSSPAYRSWYDTYSKTKGHGEDTLLSAHYTGLEPPTLTSLVMCLFGFCNILPGWWTVGNINVEERNQKGDSVLVLAALGNSVSIIKRLLEAGADVNAQISGDYGSALAAAAEEGNEAAVRLLLEAGADVNAQSSGGYGSALAAATAAVLRNEETVRLLLEAGADVNVQLKGQYSTALEAAVIHGSDATIQLLLDSGADVNAQLKGQYSTALAVAVAHRRSEAMVQLLLNAGADDMRLSFTTTAQP